jgi:hypothetical protein
VTCSRWLSGAGWLTTTAIDTVLHGLLTLEQLQVLEGGREVDFSFSWREVARLPSCCRRSAAPKGPDHDGKKAQAAAEAEGETGCQQIGQQRAPRPSSPGHSQRGDLRGRVDPPRRDLFVPVRRPRADPEQEQHDEGVGVVRGQHAEQPADRNQGSLKDSGGGSGATYRKGGASRPWHRSKGPRPRQRTPS